MQHRRTSLLHFKLKSHATTVVQNALTLSYLMHRNNRLLSCSCVKSNFPDAARTGTIVGVQGFVREASRTIVIEGKTPAELLDKLAAYKCELSAPVLCLTYISGVPWCSKILEAENGI